MKVSFAGVTLPFTLNRMMPHIDAAIALERMDTLRLGWPASALASLSFGAQARRRTPMIGSVFYPAGAGRHAVAHFLGDHQTVDDIRTAIAAGELGSEGSTGSGSGSGSGDFDPNSLRRELILDDGNAIKTFEMRMLPPKPLAGLDEPQLFLLTFVDWRYDAHADDVPDAAPYATWEEFLDAADTGELFGDDAEVEERIREHIDVLGPASVLWSDGHRWPAVIEASCATLGLRHTGESLIDPALAREVINANLEEYERVTGGFYPWGVVGDQPEEISDELAEAIPHTLKVSFKLARDGQPTDEWTTFEHRIEGGKAPALLLRSTGYVCECDGSNASASCPEPSSDGSGGSLPMVEKAAEVASYVEQLAADLVEWQKLAFLDVKLGGIVDWRYDGVHDVEWVYREGECYTRVFRAPWHDGVELVHITACEVGNLDPLVIDLPTCISLVDVSDASLGSASNPSSIGGGEE